MWKNGKWIHHDNAPATQRCQKVFGEAKDPCVGTSTLLTQSSPV
jgi:hypothetical protein